MIADPAHEVLVALSALGELPVLLRRLEKRAQRELVGLAMQAVRDRVDSITFEHRFASQVRRLAADRSRHADSRARLSALAAHVDNRRGPGREEARLLFHRVRALARAAQAGEPPVYAVRGALGTPPPVTKAASTATLGARNGVEVVHDDEYGGRPSAVESRALATAVRITETIRGPFPRAACQVHWRTWYESLGRLRGWVLYSAAPVHAFIVLGLPDEDWLPRGEGAGTLWTAAHELCHVPQSLAGRRPWLEPEQGLEHEADGQADFVLGLWLEERRTTSTSTRRAIAGAR